MGRSGGINPVAIVSLIIGVVGVLVALLILTTTTGSAAWQSASQYIAPVAVFVALFAFVIGVILKNA